MIKSLDLQNYCHDFSIFVICCIGVGENWGINISEPFK